MASLEVFALCCLFLQAVVFFHIFISSQFIVISFLCGDLFLAVGRRRGRGGKLFAEANGAHLL